MTPWTVACQASFVHGILQARILSGLPFPSPGDLPDQGLNPCDSHMRATIIKTQIENTQHPKKKADCGRIDAFELWCWRRLLRVPWTARRSNQSILKEISPEYSLEGLRLKLKLQYFGHLMRGTDSLEKTLMLGKTEDMRRG